ncbi:hypothetical protein B0H13DRAFT_2312891 [Mycena leptocephala]|nr:hypothetical protein B0H13DRAFT_2312891 [Mycena leptocephala]
MELAVRSINTLPAIAFSSSFLLSTDSFCSIVLVKSKGADGLATAANSVQNKACTNRPLVCPVSPCPDTEWKYNLKSHIQTVHPTAKLSNYRSHYEPAEGEEAALKRISKKKTRKSKKKKINFRISHEHSTEAALG